MKIKLTTNELEKCRKFSQTCALNQQEIEFGQHDTACRSTKEIGRDNLIGKIAEVAFARFLWFGYGIKTKLDFEYYPRGVWDKCDLEINGYRIDVKGTRPGSQWMLIEWNKLNFREQENLPTDCFVMLLVGWDRARDEPDGEAELTGYALKERMKANVNGTYVLKKGTTLPGKNVILQADNYGIPFRLLDKDWNRLINIIKAHPQE